eukprot:SAG11_NODE_3374_length_2490_cov_1.438310_4_plen_117_part_00
MYSLLEGAPRSRFSFRAGKSDANGLLTTASALSWPSSIASTAASAGAPRKDATVVRWLRHACMPPQFSCRTSHLLKCAALQESQGAPKFKMKVCEDCGERNAYLTSDGRTVRWFVS